MSVAELWNSNSYKAIDVDYLPASNNPGDGTVTSVGLSCSDSSLTITGSPVTGSGVINIAGGGNKWWTHPPTVPSVNLNNAGFDSSGYLSLSSFQTGNSNLKLYYGTSSAPAIQGGSLLVTDGTSVGQVYDSHFHPASVSVTSSDSSVTVTQSGGTVNLSNAGRAWSQYAAGYEVNMAQNALLNTASVQFFPFNGSSQLTLYQGFTGAATTSSGLYLCDGSSNGTGNIGHIYDSHFNPPPGSTAQNITSSDSSVTVTQTGGTTNLTGAGQSWATFPANKEVYMNNNSLYQLSAVEFSPFSSSKPLTMFQGYTDCSGMSGLYLIDDELGTGNIGRIYDSYYNPPILTPLTQYQQLSNSVNASGNSAAVVPVVQQNSVMYPGLTMTYVNLTPINITGFQGCNHFRLIITNFKMYSNLTSILNGAFFLSETPNLSTFTQMNNNINQGSFAQVVVQNNTWSSTFIPAGSTDGYALSEILVEYNSSAPVTQLYLCMSLPSGMDGTSLIYQFSNLRLAYNMIGDNIQTHSLLSTTTPIA